MNLTAVIYITQSLLHLLKKVNKREEDKKGTKHVRLLR